MTYELVNRETTNSLASFDSEADAAEAYRKLLVSNVDLADDLMIVAFNAAGEAVPREAA